MQIFIEAGINVNILGGVSFIFKKAPRPGVKDLIQKFKFIELLSGHYSISELCSRLKINRSSYYYWKTAKVIRLKKELRDKTLIETIFNNRKKFAGYRTIRNGFRKVREFRAVCPISRITYSKLCTKATSRCAKEFLIELKEKLPFKLNLNIIFTSKNF